MSIPTPNQFLVPIRLTTDSDRGIHCPFQVLVRLADSDDANHCQRNTGVRADNLIPSQVCYGVNPAHSQLSLIALTSLLVLTTQHAARTGSTLSLSPAEYLPIWATSQGDSGNPVPGQFLWSEWLPDSPASEYHSCARTHPHFTRQSGSTRDKTVYYCLQICKHRCVQSLPLSS